MTQMNLVMWALVAWIGAPQVFAAEPQAHAKKAESITPQSFQIRNQKHGQLLRPEDANSADGTRIVLYPAQAWKCLTWRFHPAGESVFCLQNHFTSKTFAAEATTTREPQPIRQVPFAKAASERPKWQFTKLSDGTYKITEPKSGKALTARKGSTDATVSIVIDSWRDTDEQKWELIPTDPKDLTM